MCRGVPGHPYPVYASDGESESVIPLSCTIVSPTKGNGKALSNLHIEYIVPSYRLHYAQAGPPELPGQENRVERPSTIADLDGQKQCPQVRAVMSLLGFIVTGYDHLTVLSKS